MQAATHGGSGWARIAGWTGLPVIGWFRDNDFHMHCGLGEKARQGLEGPGRNRPEGVEEAVLVLGPRRHLPQSLAPTSSVGSQPSLALTP